MRKYLLTVLFLSSLYLGAIAQLQSKQNWVDSVYQSLSNKERFGQLLMLRANYSKKDYLPEINQYIKDYNIGGICFFASTAEKQAEQTNLWQSMAKTPLLIGIDAEWGLGMRLKNTISYPFQMTLGSIENDSLIYEMGYQIGMECKRMGIHLINQTDYSKIVDVVPNYHIASYLGITEVALSRIRKKMNLTNVNDKKI